MRVRLRCCGRERGSVWSSVSDGRHTHTHTHTHTPQTLSHRTHTHTHTHAHTYQLLSNSTRTHPLTHTHTHTDRDEEANALSSALLKQRTSFHHSTLCLARFCYSSVLCLYLILD